MLVRLILFGTLVFLSGCGGSGGLDLGRVPATAAGSLVVSIDESSFPSLRRSLRLDPLRAVPGNTTRYRVHIRDPETGANLIPPIEVERIPGQTVQKVTATGVRVGPVVVVVVALSSAGQVLATATAEATVQTNETPAEIPVRPEANPPTITAITPSSGPQAGGTALRIEGTHFQGEVSVFVDGLAATAVSVSEDHKEIVCFSPAGLSAGAKDVQVVSSLKGEATAPGAFTYNPLATIAAVEPEEGPLAGGTAISVTGTGFVGEVTMVLGTQAVSITARSPTSVTGVTPPGLGAGPVNLTVTSSVHGNVTRIGGFTYNQVPTVASIEPSQGPLTGGTTVVLAGTGFQGEVTVTLDGAAATVTAQSPTQLTFVTPAGAGAGPADVVVSSSQNGATTLPGAFAYNAAPTIAALTTTSGPLAGGTLTTIVGSGFAGSPTVSFGGTAATVLLADSTAITVTTPARGSSGAVDVAVASVTHGVATLAGGFTYNPLPTVTSVTPIEGPLAGGNTVVVAGSGFGGAVALTLGGRSATIVASSTTRITATAPSGAGPGDAAIGVTSSAHGAATATSLYRYNPAPTIGAVTPAAGPLAGGTVISVTGSGFGGVVQVTVGAAAATVLANDTTTITCTTPPGALATTAGVTVTSSTHGIGSGGTFTYSPAPTITGISPGNGPLAGGGPIVVSGTNFAGTVMLTVGGQNAPILAQDSTTITATVPAGAFAGTAEVRVTSSTHGTVANASGYTYNPLPLILSVTPPEGPVAGGDSVVLSGAGFGGTLAVEVGGAPATVTGSNGTSITITVPAGGATGDVDIDVTSSTNGSFTLTNGYRYNPLPTLAGVSPAVGPQAGGTPILVTGTGFGGVLTVTIGGQNATVLGSTTSSISVTTPPGAGPGEVDVVVTSSTNGVGSLTDGFTYNPPPTISGVSPGQGPVAGGNLAILTGTDFGGTLAVTFGTQTATIAASDTSTISCTVPPGLGTGSVTVTVDSSTHGIATSTYVYNPLPTIVAVTPPEGRTGGGDVVAISGTGFDGNASVLIGGQAATVLGGATGTITCTTPASGSEGTVDVQVTSVTHGTFNATNAFTYRQPDVTDTEPFEGPIQGGTVILLTGDDFGGTVTVTIDGRNATVTAMDSTHVTCTTPPVPTPGDKTLVVNSSLYGSQTYPNGFTYYTWKGEVVAQRRSNSATLGMSADATLLSTGDIAVAYLDGQDDLTGTLRFASRSGTTWTTEAVVPSFESSPISGEAHIAAGPSDLVVVGARSLARKPLFASRRGPELFDVTSPRQAQPFLGGDELAVAMGTDGVTRTAYNAVLDSSGPLGTLEYAFQDATGLWNLQTVDTVTVSGVAMTLGASDEPHIAYATTTEIKYATQTVSPTWDTETIAASLGTRTPGHVLDLDGTPLVAYVDPAGLRFARRTGSGNWANQLVTFGTFQNVALGRSPDETFIAYQNLADPRPVELARRSNGGSVWNIEPVLGDWALDAGQGDSEIALVVTGSGEPGILCTQSGFGRLLTYVRHDYATVNSPPLASVTTPITYTAGPDLILTGAVTDADGDPLFFEWVYVSGPAVETPARPFDSSTRVTLTAPGVYQYDLRATDGTDIDAARLTINVP